jgi:hypothetical protein
MGDMMNKSGQFAAFETEALIFTNDSKPDYTLSFFTMLSGVETPFDFLATDFPGGDIELDLVVNYLFTFEHLPASFANSVKSAYVMDDPAGASAAIKEEEITITALNTFDPLTYKYKSGTPSIISINGQTLQSIGGSFSIDTLTHTLVWNNLVAGYDIETDDDVILVYESTGELV